MIANPNEYVGKTTTLTKLCKLKENNRLISSTAIQIVTDLIQPYKL